VSAEIIQFMPRLKHARKPAGFPRLAFRSTPRPDNPAVDEVDTSPCEYLGASPGENGIEDD
jgi:hypothetical protein